MAHHSSNPYGADQRASNAIDRQREKERRYIMQQAFRNADALAAKIVQRLLDTGILETTSEEAMREVFEKQFQKISQMEEFDLQYKIAPMRSLVANANFLSLYLAQYIIEDLIDHPKVNDIFGDDLSIYNAVHSVIKSIQPPA